MATTTTSPPPRTDGWRYDPARLKACARCSTRFDPARSTSGLRMTYCGRLCEVADLGRTIEVLEAMAGRSGKA